jgi:spore photoproduct lyase
MKKGSIKKILMEEGAESFDLVRRILGKLPGVSLEKIKEMRQIEDIPSDMGKHVLQLVKYKGDFLKPCPGTREYICCGYKILNIGTNCPLDCTYCILQSYFNTPNLRIFVNLEEELKKVLAEIDSNPQAIFRLGTGEFTDSLAVDPITGWTNILLPHFHGRTNAVLELKTKTGSIENLIESDYRRGIIVSWSLSNPFISVREEKGAKSIKERIRAAKKCQSEGYVLGFHFDPLIFHEDWKSEYMRTLDLLNDNIDPKGIIWLSMGSFRYLPELKTIIRKRHKKTIVLDGEFVLGMDRKMRYFKPIRIELYSFMKEKLDEWYKDLGIYLCMESHDVWEKALGWSPGNSIGLSNYLDMRVRQFF